MHNFEVVWQTQIDFPNRPKQWNIHEPIHQTIVVVIAVVSEMMVTTQSLNRSINTNLSQFWIDIDNRES